ncbi:hypothetical protein HOP50_05g40440 [Chloropicon primus]|uniref:Uncharacterized protein n=1 Tax=Chloropicon primus TaxID=1764295 RepID=A0A5B8MM43_9CHLO|nr:hypothetical protein A3770_05p40350 [Chloropicon primus]UPR00728.1 hypothetical protein HOP50_05g40440 [Chloropicon primus]|eukprot:QDZ21517.1 hypothetical protein A3770_05p40350 [Chloropicon primus]
MATMARVSATRTRARTRARAGVGVGRRSGTGGRRVPGGTRGEEGRKARGRRSGTTVHLVLLQRDAKGRGRKVEAKGEGEGPSTSAGEEETPVWIRREQEKELKEQDGKLPFGVYLLASGIIAIAAIASIFEYTYQNPIFSVIPPTNFLYKPILGIFVFTGLPLSGYLFYQAIQSANELSESMDKQDGVER